MLPLLLLSAALGSNTPPASLPGDLDLLADRSLPQRLAAERPDPPPLELELVPERANRPSTVIPLSEAAQRLVDLPGCGRLVRVIALPPDPFDGVIRVVFPDSLDACQGLPAVVSPGGDGSPVEIPTCESPLRVDPTDLPPTPDASAPVLQAGGPLALTASLIAVEGGAERLLGSERVAFHPGEAVSLSTPAEGYQLWVGAALAARDARNAMLVVSATLTRDVRDVAPLGDVVTVRLTHQDGVLVSAFGESVSQSLAQRNGVTWVLKLRLEDGAPKRPLESATR